MAYETDSMYFSSAIMQSLGGSIACTTGRCAASKLMSSSGLNISIFANHPEPNVSLAECMLGVSEICHYIVLSCGVRSALQANPTSVSLWIDAAAWEYEGNQNMLNARALMQQGLRLNDESQQLWSEYLRLELLYIRQIKSRQVILGVVSTRSLLSTASLQDW